MKRYLPRPRSLVATALAAMLGCASGIASGKGIVTLTKEPGPECRRLGDVSGVNPFGNAMPAPEDRTDWARGDAADQAGRIGATAIRFHPVDPKDPDRIVGTAYDCSKPAEAAAAPSSPPPAAIGCTKDTDCKGERICESGRCVEPSRPPPAQSPQ